MDLNLPSLGTITYPQGMFESMIFPSLVWWDMDSFPGGYSWMPVKPSVPFLLGNWIAGFRGFQLMEINESATCCFSGGSHFLWIRECFNDFLSPSHS